MTSSSRRSRVSPSSGGELRVAAPPDRAGTEADLAGLKELTKTRDDAALQQVEYWNAGPPSYRWQQILAQRSGVLTLAAFRHFALLHAAIHDAAIAAWDSKYVYNRPRPTAVDGSIEAVISNPHSPSYPAEHAVTAGAAAVVLSCLYPDDARQWSELANECARSRLLAGVQFPSDVEAGLALGGSDRPWTGSAPAQQDSWNGVNPVLPQMATWKPWVLASPSQFRPGPPPAFGSPELAAEMAEVKNVPRGQANGATNTAAFYWNSAAVYRLWAPFSIVRS